MTLDQFNDLPLGEQLATVFQSGAYVARRWHSLDEAVNLYELPAHFFVEVTYCLSRNELLELGSFGLREVSRLAAYATPVRLPDNL